MHAYTHTLTKNMHTRPALRLHQILHIEIYGVVYKKSDILLFLLLVNSSYRNLFSPEQMSPSTSDVKRVPACSLTDNISKRPRAKVVSSAEMLVNGSKFPNQAGLDISEMI